MITHDLLIFLIKTLEGPFPLYTHIPERVPYPYISLEILSLRQGASTLSPPGKYQALLRVQGWSRDAGATQIQTMANHIQKTLSDRLLVMGKTGKASCRTLEENTRLLNDRSTRLYETKLLMGILR